MVTEGGQAVGRHPMVGEGERTGDIPGTGAGGGIDAGLEASLLPPPRPCAKLQLVPPPASAKPATVSGVK